VDGGTAIDEAEGSLEGRALDQSPNYELWNTESRNIVGASAAEALALVQEAIDAHGANYADMLALIVDDGEAVQTLAIGAELAARARPAAARAAIGWSTTRSCARGNADRGPAKRPPG
jgi:hypothetical protein